MTPIKHFTKAKPKKTTKKKGGENASIVWRKDHVIPDTSGKMTIKMKLFVDEYIVDFNATRAASAAGYSKQTASAIGAENLRKPQIQEAIKKAILRRADRIERSGDEVVRLMWKMAELDLADYIKVAKGGEIQAIPFDELPEGATRLISKVKERRTKIGEDCFTESLEYEIPDRVKCVELLGRHYGLFKDRIGLELDEDTLRKMMTGLPPGLAELVKAAMVSAFKKKG
ncbi:MAG: terminase small subunit [Pseudomonadota bacterium]